MTLFNLNQLYQKENTSFSRYFFIVLLTLAPVFINAQPNILFIFADDQTYLGVHALGNNEVITPNLDKLVNSGVTFTHTYNMGGWNGAVCVASRAMMNTGRFIWHARNSEKTILK